MCVCAWFELEAVGWVGVLRTTTTTTTTATTNEILEQVAKAECSIPSPIVVVVADFETFTAAAAPTTSGDQIN